MKALKEPVSASRGWSADPSPKAALDNIFGNDKLDDASLGIVFASAEYNLAELGRAIEHRFPCPVIGCSTAGEITSSGYQRSGVAAAVLRGVKANVEIIDDTTSFDTDDAALLARRLGTQALDHSENAVLISLFDGLCMREESLSSQIYMATGGVPMVGGSAGDNLAFHRTSIYHSGAFHSRIGSCALVHAPSGIRTFIGHHYEDTGQVLVVTKAEPEQRRIVELNGIPAANAYAAALGTDLDRLTKADELMHPLMLRASDRWYVRGVQQLLADGSIRLYCAIDEGVVLHVGRADRAHEKLGTDLNDTCVGLKPSLVLMFDCITRRLETEHFASQDNFACVVSQYPSMGFSTYGEQFNGVHVNQTVTGVVFGEAA
ncbi:MAG: FIST C-terminal domain-containing protein [Phycisphaeraceae bacterium]|nr:FIST C-terminal domain-containing protein [Phycisphaerales bacterium]MCB9858831.1 FIST C-terminal domain-containing protein [Phycisphaeraceae bacterium]